MTITDCMIKASCWISNMNSDTDPSVDIGNLLIFPDLDDEIQMWMPLEFSNSARSDDWRFGRLEFNIPETLDFAQLFSITELSNSSESGSVKDKVGQVVVNRAAGGHTSTVSLNREALAENFSHVIGKLSEVSQDLGNLNIDRLRLVYDFVQKRYGLQYGYLDGIDIYLNPPTYWYSPEGQLQEVTS